MFFEVFRGTKILSAAFALFWILHRDSCSLSCNTWRVLRKWVFPIDTCIRTLACTVICLRLFVQSNFVFSMLRVLKICGDRNKIFSIREDRFLSVDLFVSIKEKLAFNVIKFLVFIVFKPLRLIVDSEQNYVSCLLDIFFIFYHSSWYGCKKNQSRKVGV